MAVATADVVNFTVTVAAIGTSVAPATLIPDNCYCIRFDNAGLQDAIGGRRVAGGALAIGSTGFRIPASGVYSLPLGDLQERGSDLLAIDMPAGSTVPYTINGSYLCSLSGRRTT